MLDMLYELEKMLSHAGFVRASKSVVLNVEKLTGIKTMVNSKLEAKLSNGESSMIELYLAHLYGQVLLHHLLEPLSMKIRMLKKRK